MNAKILIVDDETNVRLNYRITLETEGYQIFEAGSAARRGVASIGRAPSPIGRQAESPLAGGADGRQPCRRTERHAAMSWRESAVP